jgi:hypothetical protein
MHQYMSCMGVLNDYLAYLPMLYDSSMAVDNAKKSNVPFDYADLSRTVLNSVPHLGEPVQHDSLNAP